MNVIRARIGLAMLLIGVGLLPAKDLSDTKYRPLPAIRTILDLNTSDFFDNMEMAFRPNVFLDVHSWHFAGDGFWGPGPAVLDARSDDLKQHIAQHCKIEHWDHEDLVFTSAPTVIRRLKIAATLPEFALSYDSENRQKTPDSMRCQGIEILRGTFEYLKSIGQEGAN